MTQKRKIGDVDSMPDGAVMMGSKYCWDAQFRRYQQIEMLEKKGYTHIRIGSTISKIQTAKRHAMLKSGGICGFERRQAAIGKATEIKP